uniref:Signal peptidase I n=1 Tax=Salinispora arenicola (strain CNS-205) TaxID=391037 RepID=A8M455_SALAI
MIWTLLFSVAVAVAVAVASFLTWARRNLVVINVVGISMYPTLCEGDRVLAVRRSPPHLSPGCIVVIEQPPPWRGVAGAAPYAHAVDNRRFSPENAIAQGRWLIKRVASVPGEPVPADLANFGATVPVGHIAVLGDNPNRSDDSRRFGFLPLEEVKAVVLWVPRRPLLRRRLERP